MSFVQLSDEPAREILPGFRVRFVHSDRVTLAFWSIDRDAKLPEHSHPHEQIATLTRGEFELTVNGETRVLAPGALFVIPSNAVHSGRAITDCEILDIFAPAREDYIDKWGGIKCDSL